MHGSGGSPGGRNRTLSLRKHTLVDKKQHMSKEEKTYRDIMGPDGKVKPAFERHLLEVEVEPEDLLDKKLEDFRREGEAAVSQGILQTRYEFFHDKRFYKLSQIYERLQVEKELRLAQQEQLRLLKMKAKVADVNDVDKCEINSHVTSARGGNRPSNMKQKPSSMQIGDYGTNPPSGQKKQLGFPQVEGGRGESRGGRNRQGSTMNVFALVGNSGRQTPRAGGSSLNVREAMNINNRNGQGTGALFMTQPDQRESAMNMNGAPKTGGSAFRKHMAPLLSPGNQKLMTMNNSQAFSPMNNANEYVSPLDVEKERTKITRFLHTKERSSQVLADRERRLAERLQKMEQKQKDFEKKKRMERKQDMARLNERKDELLEKRQKVKIEQEELEQRSVMDYRKAVKESKRKMKEGINESTVKKISLEAAEHLRAKSLYREQVNTTSILEDKNNRMETQRTLEGVETRVNQHQEKAVMMRMSMSQRVGTNTRRIQDQIARHRENQEKEELEREAQLLERLSKRKKALEKYEKSKRKAAEAIADNNYTKKEMSMQCSEKRRDDNIQLARQIRQKEAQVRRKMREAEENRLEEIEVKKERQRLVQEENRKRLEFKKRNLNFKKLQVLDKHQKIDDLCSKLSQQKNSFIECTRIANEIRLQKMSQAGSPSQKKQLQKSPVPKSLDKKAV